MTSERMQAAIKELEETAVVMTHLQARHSELLKDHAEWLHSHDVAMTKIRENGRKTDKQIQDLVAAGRRTDKRIEDLVSAIGELVRKQ